MTKMLYWDGEKWRRTYFARKKMLDNYGLVFNEVTQAWEAWEVGKHKEEKRKNDVLLDD